MDSFIEWAVSNKTELGGTIFGLVYVWLSVRQSLFTWPAGIVTSFLYIWVFLDARLYAEMGLQFYYLVMSVYGWWSWNHIGSGNDPGEKLKISVTSVTLWIRLFLLNCILTFLMYFLLRRYTDSPIPFVDGLITSLSFIATWMLTVKKLEHWLIWVFVDLTCIGLYLYRGLYPSVLLFIVYTVMAVTGYYKWQKEPKEVPC